MPDARRSWTFALIDRSAEDVPLREYWRQRTAAERLSEVERLRREFAQWRYGSGDAGQRTTSRTCAAR